jgi:hypothetical protein
MVPYVLLPPRVPFTNQLMAGLLVPDSVALNWRDCPTCRLVLVGEMEIETGGGGVIKIVALAVAAV